MTTKICGCTAETCGCCEGIQTLTPLPTANRPGLSALNYRVGTHGAFLETMRARLTTMTVDAPGADGQSIETFAACSDLTTRDSSDFSIALLDGWATVADVLTFYQERIANEGYLRTATERRSILELARLVGYALRPGVAATVYLAYTIHEDRSVTPPNPVSTTIPQGSRSQSVPDVGELPQSFETSDDLEARSDWNNLQVQLTRPQNITLDNVLKIPPVVGGTPADKIFVAGTDTKLKAGDSVLFVFGDNGHSSDSQATKPDQYALRTVRSVEAQFDKNRTAIQFQAVWPLIVTATPVLAGFIATANALITSGVDQALVDAAQTLLDQTYMGSPSSPFTWPDVIYSFTDPPNVVPGSAMQAAFSDFKQDLLKKLQSPAPGPVLTDPSKFMTPLLLAQKVQPATSLQLARKLGTALSIGADTISQLLVKFAPGLSTTFYTAWANATVNRALSSLKGIFGLGVEAPLFGTSVPNMVTYDQTTNPPQIRQPDQWDPWPIDLSDNPRQYPNGGKSMFLDQAYDAIQTNYVMIQWKSLRWIMQLSTVQTVQRAAYGITGRTTQLIFADNWYAGIPLMYSGQAFIPPSRLSDLQPVLVRAQTQELTLVEEDINGDVQGQEIPLDDLYDSLSSGRWVIVSGERADIPGVTGVQATELLMISGLRQDVAGDKTRTTLLLATPMAYVYDRSTVTIYGNVAKATHGETRNETLGNGDGSQSLQSFTLKQPPLTFVPGSNPKGVDSSLQIFVNDVQWNEVDTLVGLGPKDRKFITKTDDDDKTSVIFGDGEQGARLPTGMANVKSVYRNGIGKPGNVKAGQISLLQTRPLGVQSVVNPLPATGGADSENLDQARENAPLGVMPLNRLVSVEDYADFARTFAGIDKAAAQKLSDSKRELVHVTIAGADDIPIDETSDLYQNLVIALRDFGDPDLPLQVDLRELVVLVLSANVRLAADYQWDPVATSIRTTLLDYFGFQNRALGQPAWFSEVISVIQNTAGVEYVEVDAFGGIPGTMMSDGTRQVLSPDQIAQQVQQILGQKSLASRVDANLAHFESGALCTAQLVIFADAVPDTLILNQIK
jgi:hypothetical protein